MNVCSLALWLSLEMVGIVSGRYRRRAGLQLDDYAFDKLIYIFGEDFGSQVIGRDHIPLSFFPVWDHLQEHLYLIITHFSPEESKC